MENSVFYHFGFDVADLVFQKLPFWILCSGFSVPGFTIPDLGLAVYRTVLDFVFLVLLMVQFSTSQGFFQALCHTNFFVFQIEFVKGLFSRRKHEEISKRGSSERCKPPSISRVEF